MFNSVALEVVIGLIFIYLLYSLLATILQETVAHLLSLRGRMLYKAIRRMLEDDSHKKMFIEKFYNHPSIKYLAENNLFKKPSYLGSDTFSQTLIHILRGDGFDNDISQMQAIKNKLDEEAEKLKDTKTPTTSEINKETLLHLINLHTDAMGDIDRFRKWLEQWFDETMQRTSGWYKRQTQWILFIVGLLIAASGNVDTLKLRRILATNESAREQMVQMAIKSQEKYSTVVSVLNDTSTKAIDGESAKFKVIPSTGDSVLNETYNTVKDDAENAKNILGMGYHSSKNYKANKSLVDSIKATDSIINRKDSILIRIKKSKLDPVQKEDSILKVLKESQQLRDKKNAFSIMTSKLQQEIYDEFDGATSVLGWILTAFAISLGAPFWFDLLNKVVKLRVSGTKPEEETLDNSGGTTNKTVGSNSAIQRKG